MGLNAKPDGLEKFVDVLVNNKPLLTVNVEGFLGINGYDVSLPLLDSHKRVKIITGANGIGKTRLLELYDAVMRHPPKMFPDILKAGASSIEVSGGGQSFKVVFGGDVCEWSSEINRIHCIHRSILENLGIEHVVKISPEVFFTHRFNMDICDLIIDKVASMAHDRTDMLHRMARRYFGEMATLLIDPDMPFPVTCSIETRLVGKDRRINDISTMSLGQQYGIYMYSELLTNSNALFLIDGPEFDGHLVAIDDFIDNLEEICSATNSWAIVATHSPSVIGCNRDIAYSLDCVRRGEEPQ